MVVLELGFFAKTIRLSIEMNLYKYNIATDMTTVLVPLGRTHL